MPSLLFVHALSPLHAGTGHAIGAVDLPIARDKATGFPYVPGSSIKGVLRDTARQRKLESTEAVFGPDRDHASDHAGALIVGDANLLLLPARSLVGTFAWVTCPWLLRKLARDAHETGIAPLPAIPELPSVEKAAVSTKSTLVTGDRVVFEDLDFTRASDKQVDALGDWIGGLLFPETMTDHKVWRDLLVKKLCVLHDDSMAYFSEHGTDIVTRIALDPDKKTVKDGALWTEESLPSETVLVGLMAGQSVRETNEAAVLGAARTLLGRPVQLGGDATTGRGRCRAVMTGAAK